MRATELCRGCVVMMKSTSGLVGYGNAQCIKSVSEALGEISLFGHNKCYKTHDVKEVIEYPILSEKEALNE